MMMNGRYVLISGSASRSCPADKLDLAIRFVASFTTEVLRRQGGVVVLAGGEEASRNQDGTPLIFDWVALRAVERFAESTTGDTRPYARVVMSDEAPEAKIDYYNLNLLKNLEQRGVVERVHIRREIFTGGEYRATMIELADAMVAVGGGRGTYSAGDAMSGLGKPVLPLDLQLGSIADDGAGAVALHREMMSDPHLFFPDTHETVKDRIGLLSLDRGLVTPEVAAQTAAEMVFRELQADTPECPQPIRSKNLLLQTGRLLKEIPLVAAALRIIEFLRNLVVSLFTTVHV